MLARTRAGPREWLSPLLPVLVLALFCSCLPVVSALGNYKYCCDIEKCKNVTTQCGDDPKCSAACDRSCANLDQLSVKDYSCFAKYLNATAGNALGVVCNQTYDPLIKPAPSFLISYGDCSRDCSGWQLADPSKPNTWAAPILQYILPVVVFSMTIPRRQKWEVKDWWFDFELNRIENIPFGFFSLIFAGLVVTADMTVWVFAIFVGAGPMLVGGIHEAVLDYTIVQHLEDKHHVPRVEFEENGRVVRQESQFPHLSEEDKVELMLAILSGNLDKSVGDPQNILRRVIGLPEAIHMIQPDRRRGSRFLMPRGGHSPRGSRERNSVTLSRTNSPNTPLMADIGQISSGADEQVTGAGDGNHVATDHNPQPFRISRRPVAPRARTPEENESDLIAFRERRARLDVAEIRLKSMLQAQYSFGSIVGAPVLFYIGAFIYTLVGLSANKGDNDTAHALAFGMWWMGIVHVAIVSGCLLASNNPSTVTAIVAEHLAGQGLKQRKSAADGKSELTFLLMSPVYHSQFMPVPLWDRGRMKKMWIESTNAYNQHEWFRNRIRLRYAWAFIPAAAFFLILVPSALAFAVSYTTPRVCLSCRSLTFLIYTLCQLVLIIGATFHTRYTTTSYSASAAISSIVSFIGHLHPVGLIVYSSSIVIALAAIILSLFTASAGTLMQIMGVYKNCLCSIPANSWLTTRDSEMFELPTDTAADRDASIYWAGCGYTAIAFMAIVCYIGWWYQRYLRRRFLQRISALAPSDSRRVVMSGAIPVGAVGAYSLNQNGIEMAHTSHLTSEGVVGRAVGESVGDEGMRRRVETEPQAVASPTV